MSYINTLLNTLEDLINDQISDVERLQPTIEKDFIGNTYEIYKVGPDKNKRKFYNACTILAGEESLPKIGTGHYKHSISKVRKSVTDYNTYEIIVPIKVIIKVHH